MREADANVAGGPSEFGHQIPFAEALKVWLRVSLLSFGGPAGQISVMHHILVDEKRWISENRFLHALNYCMVLPGPEAQQLATYIGWLLHGLRGGLVAGCLFVLPGFLSILLLSLLYAGFQETTLVQALFFGIKAAVLAIVVQAVIRIGGKALKNGYMVALWFIPLIVLSATLGLDNVFTQIGLFFSKLAVVSFGGAYSVLAYMAQEAVQNYGWLSPGEMMDGLGMAETTPGPLIQVVQFTGFMGAFRDPGALNPFAAGIMASVLATWVTFVPCFLWIFLGAPYVETLRGNLAVSAALSAVTAAVVGVILNLAVWFAVHVAFTEVDTIRAYGLHLLVPGLHSMQIASVVLALAAFVAMLRFKIGMLTVIAASALLGIAYQLLFGGATAA